MGRNYLERSSWTEGCSDLYPNPATCIANSAVQCVLQRVHSCIVHSCTLQNAKGPRMALQEQVGLNICKFGTHRLDNLLLGTLLWAHPRPSKSNFSWAPDWSGGSFESWGWGLPLKTPISGRKLEVMVLRVRKATSHLPGPQVILWTPSSGWVQRAPVVQVCLSEYRQILVSGVVVQEWNFCRKWGPPISERELFLHTQKLNTTEMHHQFFFSGNDGFWRGFPQEVNWKKGSVHAHATAIFDKTGFVGTCVILKTCTAY